MAAFTVSKTNGTTFEVIKTVQIGEGGEGFIHRGTIGGQDVLIKTMKMDRTTRFHLRNNIETEVHVLSAMNKKGAGDYFATFRAFIGPRAFCESVVCDSRYKLIGPTDTVYLIYNFIEGGDLYDIIRKGTLHRDEKVSILKQLLTALQVLHASGFVHRDIKPENLMLTPEGQLKIIDIGQACEGYCMFDKPVGSPEYSAPETIPIASRTNANLSKIGNYAAPSDIFMAGLTFFDIVTGALFTRVVANQDPRRTILQIGNYLNRPEPRRMFQAAEMDEYYNLFLSMINPDLSQRPTAHEALEELDKIDPTLNLSGISYHSGGSRRRRRRLRRTRKTRSRK